MELSRACSFVQFFCTAKQHKTALSFLVFRVIAAHVNPISTPQHTRYRGPHKRALSMQRSVANPPTDSLALQRETPVAHVGLCLITLQARGMVTAWKAYGTTSSVVRSSKSEIRAAS